jgi:hypothetical protein
MSTPWAIILCRFNDIPLETRQPSFYQDFYATYGTGGVCDYWSKVTYGSVDLAGTKVFGWFTMNHTSSEVAGLNLPTDRWVLVQWGIDTAKANQVDLSPFQHILVVQNYGKDHGFAGIGVIVVHSNPTLVEFGFNCHEMGHALGLPHSFGANPDTEYGDGWDIMSWDKATNDTSDFAYSFEGANGKAGPGLNARNLLALNAALADPGRTYVWPGQIAASIDLHPLNQPLLATGYLVAQIPPNSTNPPRSSNSTFTIEYRHKDGPDQGIPQDVVLIHEIRTDQLSYLQPTWGGQFVAGDSFTTPSPEVSVRVTKIDPGSQTATVEILTTTTVPNVLGLRPAEALDRIQQAGLLSEIVRTYPAEVPWPKVEDQNPAGGVVAIISTYVYLTVAEPSHRQAPKRRKSRGSRQKSPDHSQGNGAATARPEHIDAPIRRFMSDRRNIGIHSLQCNS